MPRRSRDPRPPDTRARRGPKGARDLQPVHRAVLLVEWSRKGASTESVLARLEESTGRKASKDAALYYRRWEASTITALSRKRIPAGIEPSDALELVRKVETSMLTPRNRGRWRHKGQLPPDYRE